MASFSYTNRLLADRWALDARTEVAHEEKRRAVRSTQLGLGTLACSRCDAPVAIGPDPLSAAAQLTCPFCGTRGPVRDFLSLASPTRPARVVVRVLVSGAVRRPDSTAHAPSAIVPCPHAVE